MRNSEKISEQEWYGKLLQGNFNKKMIKEMEDLYTRIEKKESFKEAQVNEKKNLIDENKFESLVMGNGFVTTERELMKKYQASSSSKPALKCPPKV